MWKELQQQAEHLTEEEPVRLPSAPYLSEHNISFVTTTERDMLDQEVAMSNVE